MLGTTSLETDSGSIDGVAPDQELSEGRREVAELSRCAVAVETNEGAVVNCSTTEETFDEDLTGKEGWRAGRQDPSSCSETPPPLGSVATREST